jgi:hypothetical protein
VKPVSPDRHHVIFFVLYTPKTTVQFLMMHYSIFNNSGIPAAQPLFFVAQRNICALTFLHCDTLFKD